ncbi:C-X-C motif chemokine 11 [Microtus oregoni]|uniref:C-X-C motif chemokine 11 n=1 Tax=Microtus oregoni TaxID=111838 RepID=UPI001BB22074|nr:C-X-C motif chemokine 11 [Microtus oregoni]
MFLLQPSTVLCRAHRSRGRAAAAGVDMKGIAIAFAVLICATAVQGFTMFRAGRCLCIDPGVKAVRMADIERVSIIYPTRGCAKVEVIVTLKANKGETCLNPKSKQAHIIQQAIERKSSLKRQNHVKS